MYRTVCVSRDPIHSGFIGFKDLSWCPAELVSGHKKSWPFPAHKNKTYLAIRTNILTFPTVKDLVYSSRRTINNLLTGRTVAT